VPAPEAPTAPNRSITDRPAACNVAGSGSDRVKGRRDRCATSASTIRSANGPRRRLARRDAAAGKSHAASAAVPVQRIAATRSNVSVRERSTAS